MRYGGAGPPVPDSAPGMGGEDPESALLARLQEAEGQPVAHQELVAMGIPQPAMLVYELQAAGYFIEYIRGPSGELAYRLRGRPRG